MATETKPGEGKPNVKLRWKGGKTHVQLKGCGPHSNDELNDPAIGANLVKILKKRGQYDEFVEPAI